MIDRGSQESAGKRPGHARERALAVGLALGLLSTLLGCGYRFLAQGGDLPGKARTLFVPVFKNRTVEAGVETWFTEAFRDELARLGREGGNASDAIAEGEVVQIVGGPSIVTNMVDNGASGLQVGGVASSRVQATVLVRVIRDGRQVGETTVTGFEDFQPDVCTQNPACCTDDKGCKEVPSTADWQRRRELFKNSILVSEAHRRLALRRLSQSMMREAVANLTSGF